MKTMTKRDLDPLGCGTPGCTENHNVLYMHSKCCEDAATWTRYEKDTGEVVVECAECGKDLVRIKVAEE